MTTVKRARASAPLLAFVAVVLGGCAPLQSPTAATAPSAAPPGAPDLEQIARAEEAMRAPESELLAAQAGQGAPECARACLLQDNVCALAERICAITARYPATDPVRGRCVDGQARCRRAREAVASRCRCPASQ